ncbi:MAG TPA: hypothetical protein VGH66_12505 [Acidimicrobiales bacterium]|jgi:hypothetical protein
MTWNRSAVAAALVDVLGPATGVTVHPRPPEIVNPMCVVVSRPQLVQFSAAAMGIDEATLPLIIVGGLETEDRIETLKEQCAAAVRADQTLGGAVAAAWPAEERNWLNMTGAGGVQLLRVDLMLTVQM